MLNLTLVVNCAATVGLATAVVLVRDTALVALALAYVSGLLTAWASRYQVGLASAPEAGTSTPGLHRPG